MPERLCAAAASTDSAPRATRWGGRQLSLTL
jgi:hypothetical protein